MVDFHFEKVLFWGSKKCQVLGVFWGHFLGAFHTVFEGVFVPFSVSRNGVFLGSEFCHFSGQFWV